MGQKELYNRMLRDIYRKGGTPVRQKRSKLGGFGPIGKAVRWAEENIEAYTGKTSAQVEKENLALAQEQFDYTKGIQERTWEREDTAIQRRVADYKAAGLSPVLAAGGSGAGSTAIATTPPKRGTVDYSGIGNLATIFMNLIRMDADISKTRAEEERLQTQTNVDEHDLGIARKKGIPIKNPSILGKNYRDLTNIVDTEIKKLLKKSYPQDLKKIDRSKKLKTRIKKDPTKKHWFHKLIN